MSIKDSVIGSKAPQQVTKTNFRPQVVCLYADILIASKPAKNMWLILSPLPVVKFTFHLSCV